MAKLSNPQLVRVVSDEGGVIDTLASGLRSGEIADTEMASVWARAEAAYLELAPLVVELESRLGQVE